jgi:F420-dependent oxidoreductase-like protein
VRGRTIDPPRSQPVAAGIGRTGVAHNVRRGRGVSRVASLPVRFSLWPTTAQPYADLFDAAAHAAATGWDGVWVADHFMAPAPPLDEPRLECWTVLAGLATTVPRVRLGSLVSGNTYRHPAVLANMAATVDHLSGGRVVLGIGAGWQHNEHEAYGIELFDVPERLVRLDEACTVLRQLLDRHRSDFEGRWYRLVNAPMEPKPVQAKLPLLIGGGGERVTLRIAARWADEWNTWGTPDVLAAKGLVLDRHCAAIGRDPAEITRSAQVIVDLDGKARPYDRPMPVVRAGVQELQDLLGAYTQCGVSEFVLPDWNLGTGAARRESMDRFLGEVAAPLRANA